MSVVARRNRPAAPVAFMTAGLFASFSGLLNLVSGFCLARPSLQWGEGDGRMAAGVGGAWPRLRLPEDHADVTLRHATKIAFQARKR
jgi:hypothetical protein